ncbi:MAG TPA: c-type cytochrome [Chthoniobacteraceae bacterium]|nr:c-type cytochrome [Chthoniobacteraceae bacterium]
MSLPIPCCPRARLFVLLTMAAIGSSTLWALHEKNAGPETFEIKFKLPPPKPLTPEEELATFKIAPGFRAELVAAEPMVDTPVALSWDENGRMFVCEMRGYMHDVDGKGEDQPLGRIVVLEDTNADGQMDKRTVFADGLILPRAVMCVNGGALVGEPPFLWFMKDTNGDGKADVKEQVDDKFGSRTGQPEHMANSPTWLLDNWIQSANHSTRYRLRGGKFVAESTASRGQWGMSQDDFGRPFYNFNSDFLRANFVPDSLGRRNPNFPSITGLGVQVLPSQVCWPSHPTPGVNRGYEPKQLREDGTLASSTATCGAAIYRGGLFPTEFAGNAFIPEPSGNLVKRVIIDEKDAVLTARNAYDKAEFWTSTDERFRPVNAYTGPDGALYVVDMYRGVIQHKGFLTHYLIANIKDRKLEEPLNCGRIWRIVPDGVKAGATKLPSDSAKLVEALANPNGWVRDTAQRLLVERADTSVVPNLVATVKTAPSSVAKFHALWTLEGLGAVEPGLLSAALVDKDPKVRATAVRLGDRTFVPELAKLTNEPAAEVQIALGFVLSSYPEGQEATLKLARQAGAQTLVRDAILSGLRGRELETVEALLAGPGEMAPREMVASLAQAVLNERRSGRVKTLLKLIAAQEANSPVQRALLEGASGKSLSAGKTAPKAKLLYLDSEPPEIAQLLETADAKAKPLVVALNTRLAWANKHGVPPPPVIKPLTPAEQQLFDAGKTLYAGLCAACHQPNGLGMEGLAPTLVDSEWVLGKADVLSRIVLHGLSGPITVNGQPWSLEMPPLGAALNDEQIAGILTYIRREWEHNASAVTVEEVARLRTEHKNRTRAWTGPELSVGEGKRAAAKP